MSEPFRFAQVIRFGDLDAMRHLNNVEFLRFFETARIEYMSVLMPEHDPAAPEGGFALIFAGCEINYRSPGHFGEEVLTTLRPDRLGVKSFRLAFEMDVAGRRIADGHGTLVGYDYAAAATIELPAGLRDRLRAHGARETA